MLGNPDHHYIQKKLSTLPTKKGPDFITRKSDTANRLNLTAVQDNTVKLTELNSKDITKKLFKKHPLKATTLTKDWLTTYKANFNTTFKAYIKELASEITQECRRLNKPTDPKTLDALFDLAFKRLYRFIDIHEQYARGVFHGQPNPEERKNINQAYASLTKESPDLKINTAPERYDAFTDTDLLISLCNIYSLQENVSTAQDIKTSTLLSFERYFGSESPAFNVTHNHIFMLKDGMDTLIGCDSDSSTLKFKNTPFSKLKQLDQRDIEKKLYSYHIDSTKFDQEKNALKAQLKRKLSGDLDKYFEPLSNNWLNSLEENIDAYTSTPTESLKADIETEIKTLDDIFEKAVVPQDKIQEFETIKALFNKMPSNSFSADELLFRRSSDTASLSDDYSTDGNDEVEEEVDEEEVVVVDEEATPEIFDEALDKVRAEILDEIVDEAVKKTVNEAVDKATHEISDIIVDEAINETVNQLVELMKDEESKSKAQNQMPTLDVVMQPDRSADIEGGNKELHVLSAHQTQLPEAAQEAISKKISDHKNALAKTDLTLTDAQNIKESVTKLSDSTQVEITQNNNAAVTIQGLVRQRIAQQKLLKLRINKNNDSISAATERLNTEATLSKEDKTEFENSLKRLTVQSKQAKNKDEADGIATEVATLTDDINKTIEAKTKEIADLANLKTEIRKEIQAIRAELTNQVVLNKEAVAPFQSKFENANMQLEDPSLNSDTAASLNDQLANIHEELNVAIKDQKAIIQQTIEEAKNFVAQAEEGLNNLSQLTPDVAGTYNDRLQTTKSSLKEEQPSKDVADQLLEVAKKLSGDINQDITAQEELIARSKEESLSLIHNMNGAISELKSIFPEENSPVKQPLQSLSNNLGDQKQKLLDPPISLAQTIEIATKLEALNITLSELVQKTQKEILSQIKELNTTIHKALTPFTEAIKKRLLKNRPTLIGSEDLAARKVHLNTLQTFYEQLNVDISTFNDLAKKIQDVYKNKAPKLKSVVDQTFKTEKINKVLEELTKFENALNEENLYHPHKQSLINYINNFKEQLQEILNNPKRFTFLEQYKTFVNDQLVPFINYYMKPDSTAIKTFKESFATLEEETIKKQLADLPAVFSTENMYNGGAIIIKQSVLELVDIVEHSLRNINTDFIIPKRGRKNLFLYSSFMTSFKKFSSTLTDQIKRLKSNPLLIENFSAFFKSSFTFFSNPDLFLIKSDKDDPFFKFVTRLKQLSVLTEFNQSNVKKVLKIMKVLQTDFETISSKENLQIYVKKISLQESLKQIDLGLDTKLAEIKQIVNDMTSAKAHSGEDTVDHVKYNKDELKIVNLFQKEAELYEHLRALGDKLKKENMAVPKSIDALTVPSDEQVERKRTYKTFSTALSAIIELLINSLLTDFLITVDKDRQSNFDQKLRTFFPKNKKVHNANLDKIKRLLVKEEVVMLDDSLDKMRDKVSQQEEKQTKYNKEFLTLNEILDKKIDSVSKREKPANYTKLVLDKISDMTLANTNYPIDECFEDVLQNSGLNPNQEKDAIPQILKLLFYDFPKEDELFDLHKEINNDFQDDELIDKIEGDEIASFFRKLTEEDRINHLLTWLSSCHSTNISLLTKSFLENSDNPTIYEKLIDKALERFKYQVPEADLKKTTLYMFLKALKVNLPAEEVAAMGVLIEREIKKQPDKLFSSSLKRSDSSRAATPVQTPPDQHNKVKETHHRSRTPSPDKKPASPGNTTPSSGNDNIQKNILTSFHKAEYPQHIIPTDDLQAVGSVSKIRTLVTKLFRQVLIEFGKEPLPEVQTPQNKSKELKKQNSSSKKLKQGKVSPQRKLGHIDDPAHKALEDFKSTQKRLFEFFESSSAALLDEKIKLKSELKTDNNTDKISKEIKFKILRLEILFKLIEFLKQNPHISAITTMSNHRDNVKAEIDLFKSYENAFVGFSCKENVALKKETISFFDTKLKSFGQYISDHEKQYVTSPNKRSTSPERSSF